MFNPRCQTGFVPDRFRAPVSYKQDPRIERPGSLSVLDPSLVSAKEVTLDRSADHFAQQLKLPLPARLEAEKILLSQGHPFKVQFPLSTTSHFGLRPKIPALRKALVGYGEFLPEAMEPFDWMAVLGFFQLGIDLEIFPKSAQRFLDQFQFETAFNPEDSLGQTKRLQQVAPFFTLINQKHFSHVSAKRILELLASDGETSKSTVYFLYLGFVLFPFLDHQFLIGSDKIRLGQFFTSRLKRYEKQLGVLEDEVEDSSDVAIFENIHAVQSQIFLFEKLIERFDSLAFDHLVVPPLPLDGEELFSLFFVLSQIFNLKSSSSEGRVVKTALAKYTYRSMDKIEDSEIQCVLISILNGAGYTDLAVSALRELVDEAWYDHTSMETYEKIVVQPQVFLPEAFDPTLVIDADQAAQKRKLQVGSTEAASVYFDLMSFLQSSVVRLYFAYAPHQAGAFIKSRIRDSGLFEKNPNVTPSYFTDASGGNFFLILHDVVPDSLVFELAQQVLCHETLLEWKDEALEFVACLTNKEVAREIISGAVGNLMRQRAHSVDDLNFFRLALVTYNDSINPDWFEKTLERIGEQKRKDFDPNKLSLFTMYKMMGASRQSLIKLAYEIFSDPEAPIFVVTEALQTVMELKDSQIRRCVSLARRFAENMQLRFPYSGDLSLLFQTIQLAEQKLPPAPAKRGFSFSRARKK